jgi:hypothetical protein
MMVEITEERYERLLASEDMLAALEAAGVDNWQGYDDAMDILREWKLERNKEPNATSVSKG